jgi:hypothetical protein
MLNRNMEKCRVKPAFGGGIKIGCLVVIRDHHIGFKRFAKHGTGIFADTFRAIFRAHRRQGAKPEGFDSLAFNLRSRQVRSVPWAPSKVWSSSTVMYFKEIDGYIFIQILKIKEENVNESN